MQAVADKFVPFVDAGQLTLAYYEPFLQDTQVASFSGIPVLVGFSEYIPFYTVFVFPVFHVPNVLAQLACASYVALLKRLFVLP